MRPGTASNEFRRAGTIGRIGPDRAAGATKRRLLVAGLGTMCLAWAAPPIAAARVRETFREPPVWRSEDGVLRGDLEMRRARTRLGGRRILTLTYGGTIPGPTWRIKPGDRIAVRLINNMTPSAPAPTIVPAHQHGVGFEMETPSSLFTNLHVHGLQVDPRGNGDNVYLEIAPGQYFDFDIPVPANQPSGLFFYHPHRHRSATGQFWNGLQGAIIVEGGLDAVPAIQTARERLIVVSELVLNELGHVPAGTPVPTAGPVDFSTVPAVPSQIYFPINGILEPRLTIHPGETQRWRIVNGAAHRALELALERRDTGERIPMHQIAQDGINFPTSKARDTILLAPGNRVEVLVQPDRRGVYQLKSLPHDQGHPGGTRPGVLLATLVSAGRRVSDPTTFPLPLIPTQMPDISKNPIDNTRTVEWSGEVMTAPLVFQIDGKVFDPQRSDQTITVGTTELWTLVNHDVFQHPFHIHVNPFQVIAINGQPYPEPDVWWDTFSLPSKGTVTLRIFFRPDVIGTTVFHCHILPHEDLGMMSRIDLVPPGPPPPPVPPVGPFPTGKPIPPAGTPRFKRLRSRPYVFTQLYPEIAGGQAARVPVGRAVEVQLPGMPTQWTPSIDGDAVRQRADETVYPSIGQFDGASALIAIPFKAVRRGSAAITFDGTPVPPPWLQDPYVLRLETSGR